MAFPVPDEGPVKPATLLSSCMLFLLPVFAGRAYFAVGLRRPVEKDIEEQGSSPGEEVRAVTQAFRRVEVLVEAAFPDELDRGLAEVFGLRVEAVRLEAAREQQVYVHPHRPPPVLHG